MYRPVNWGKIMFDHVKFGVSDYSASKAFYVKALQPLGVTGATEWPPNGVELYHPKGEVSLCLYKVDWKTRPSSLGVRCQESATSRSILLRSSRSGWQGQWSAWSAPALSCELLCSFRNWPWRAQHWSGLPQARGLKNSCNRQFTQYQNRDWAGRYSWSKSPHCVVSGS